LFCFFNETKADDPANREITELMQEAERLGDEGKVEESMALLEKAEDLRKRKVKWL
jgi:hypothetical protein